MGPGGRAAKVGDGAAQRTPLAPRGRSSPDEPALEHSSKKPRDDDEEGEAADDDDGGEKKAELYQAPGLEGSAEWESLSMFDSDDLDENEAFLLLCYDSSNKPKSAQFWLGGESPLSYERDSDIAEVARDFLQSKGLAELPLTLVFQGEETDGFWEYFVNG